MCGFVGMISETPVAGALLLALQTIQHRGQDAAGCGTWSDRRVHLVKGLGLINQALEIIEKRGGDFEIVSFSATPNDQRTEFNFRRTSSITLKIFGVDGAALDDITARLQSLVDVLESAEGVLTTIPEPAA